MQETLSQLHFHEPLYLVWFPVFGGVVTALATWIGAPAWSMARRTLAFVAGLLLATALGAALASPYRLKEHAAPVSRVVLVDASASHRPAELDAAIEQLFEERPDLDTGAASLVVHGRTGVQVQRGRVGAAALGTRIARELAGDVLAGSAEETARALQTASALCAGEHELELTWLTDGRSPPPSQAVARRLREQAESVRILLSGRALASIRPVSLQVPPVIREAEPFELGLHVAGGAGEHAVTVQELPVREGGATLLTRAVVDPEDGIARFGPLSLSAGYYLARAVHLGADDLAEDDVLSEILEVRARPRVLLVHGRPVPRPDDLLFAALDAQGLNVTARNEQPSIAELLAAHLVVLNDVHPQELDPRWLSALADHVITRGAGLLVVAGEAEDNHVGWSATPLGGLLPVEFRVPLPPPPPETEEGDEELEPDPEGEPELAEGKVARFGMVLCIDRSGSMEGDKIEMAKYSAVRAAQEMHPDDEIAVVAFDSTAHVALPFTRAGEERTIQSTLRSLRADGSTNVYGALKMSRDLLLPRSGDFAIRHVVLMTDGYSMTGGDYGRMCESMTAAGITVSTIAIGDEFHRKLLSFVAQKTGGRIEHARSFDRLPVLVARDVAYHAGLLNRPPPRDDEEEETPPEVETPTDEATEQPEGAPPTATDEAPLAVATFELRPALPVPWLFDAEGEPFAPPAFGGVAAADLRPTAQLQAVAVADPDDPEPAPLLVAARVGRGRVLMHLTDLGGVWTEDWYRWSALPAYLAQVSRSVLPPFEPGRHRLEVTMERRADDARVHVSLHDASGVPVERTPLTVEVLRPEGRQPLRLRPDPLRGGFLAVAPLPSPQAPPSPQVPEGEVSAEERMAPVELPNEHTWVLRVTAGDGDQLLAERMLTLERREHGDRGQLDVQQEAWARFAETAGAELELGPPHEGTTRRSQEDLRLYPLLAAAALVVLLTWIRRSS